MSCIEPERVSFRDTSPDPMCLAAKLKDDLLNLTDAMVDDLLIIFFFSLFPLVDSDLNRSVAVSIFLELMVLNDIDYTSALILNNSIMV